jgi:glycosyltransferase involved in cell wall biosynthesis
MTQASIPCSVEIIVRNNVEGLRTCLIALQDFDEIIVLDGYSTDGTREMAATYPNVRIVDQKREYLDADGRIIHFGNMHNVGIAAATNPWMFIIDSDEEMTPELVAEIRGLVERNVPGVFRVSRIFTLDGVRIDHCPGYPSYQIRLFHKTLTYGVVKAVHEKHHLKEGVQVQTMQSVLLIPLAPLPELRQKYDRYLRMEAIRMRDITVGHWCQWILYRNLKTALGLSILILWSHSIPRRGTKLPIGYEWAQVMYSLRLIVRTCPLRLRRTSGSSSTQS